MHKDKPPGIFDLGERSMRYAAGFCFFIGFLVSVIVRIGLPGGRAFFAIDSVVGFLNPGKLAAAAARKRKSGGSVFSF